MPILNRTLLFLILCLGLSGLSSLIAAPRPDELSPSSIKAGREYVNLLREAGILLARRDFPAVLSKLDAADNIKANLPDSLNIRGAVYLEMKEYAKANQFFEQALKIQPGAFWPKFNLAEINLLQKKSPEARAGFEAIRISGGYSELINFKIVETYLVEGSFEVAGEHVAKMKFPGDSAAYYFAHAAFELAQGKKEKGMEWVKSGEGVFGKARTSFFYDSLADLGWVESRYDKSE